MFAWSDLHAAECKDDLNLLELTYLNSELAWFSALQVPKSYMDLLKQSWKLELIALFLTNQKQHQKAPFCL